MSTQRTKSVNDLAEGDLVTRISDPAFPDYGPEFTEPHPVVSVTAVQGQVCMVRSDGGRFWTFTLNDRRLAHLA